MVRFRRLCFLLLIFPFVNLSAVSYDDDTLLIFAKLAPRMVMLSSLREQVTEEIGICIVSDTDDAGHALSLAEMISVSYLRGIKGHPVSVTPTDFSHLSPCAQTHLMFLFNTSAEAFEDAIRFSRRHHILTTVYDEQLLEKGGDVSLHLGRKVRPVLNLKTLETKGIVMDNPLIQISKIYERPPHDQ